MNLRESHRAWQTQCCHLTASTTQIQSCAGVRVQCLILFRDLSIYDHVGCMEKLITQIILFKPVETFK